MPEMIDNVLNFASIVEPNTLEQAAQTARLPFVAGHVALMPDAHLGYGSTVGSVIPTKGAIIPAAIGVDIGCGMIAVQTSLYAHQLPDDLGRLHGAIREAVPAGMGQGHPDARVQAYPTHFPSRPDVFKYLTERQQDKAVKQFGSLGGGNHFVEVSLDDRDVVWVVLHSGSRGIGHELANIHIDGAKALMARYFIDLEDRDLAYLVEGTPEFAAYIDAMLWAQDYAMGNREAMMDAVLWELAEAIGLGESIPVPEVQRINCHHNYTERENHNGENVWLTRKGAIRARTGDLGIIPGSMGTSTYIVSGLGNTGSYCSCSHGAGRVLSRSAAHRQLDVDAFVGEMNAKGIVWDDRDAERLLDEAPLAYKDIDVVMEDSKDLVTIEHRLHQVLNYKGVDDGNRRTRRRGPKGQQS